MSIDTAVFNSKSVGIRLQIRTRLTVSKHVGRSRVKIFSKTSAMDARMYPQFLANHVMCGVFIERPGEANAFPDHRWRLLLDGTAPVEGCRPGESTVKSLLVLQSANHVPERDAIVSLVGTDTCRSVSAKGRFRVGALKRCSMAVATRALIGNGGRQVLPGWPSDIIGWAEMAESTESPEQPRDVRRFD